MGKVLKRGLTEVTVNHPRRPYRIKAYQHPNIPDFIIVRLTKGFCRILHPPTGLTITDTENIKIAESFIIKMEQLFRNNEKLKLCFDELSWDAFLEHQREEIFDPSIEYIINKTREHTCAVGHVGRNMTKGCRYKYSPEYLT